MNNENYKESLIARVLSGEASAVEIAEVQQWKQESPDNQKQFDALQQIFNLSADAALKENFDTDAAWLKVKSKIRKAPVVSISRPPKLSVQQVLFRIAAVILLVAGMSYTIYNIILPEKVNPVTLASGEQTKELTLPDSTRIVLNRNSQIVYKYSSHKRIVELKGEAYLDLAQDPTRPFELTAGTLNIIDIGTAFNVNAPENSDSVVVIVTNGELKLTSPGNKSISLVKGEQAVYYKQRDEFIKATIADTNALAYKTKIFVFENASLEIIVAKLSEVYNEKISLEGEIATCHLTATFKDETLENILDIIAGTLNLDVTKGEHGFILKGEICED